MLQGGFEVGVGVMTELVVILGLDGDVGVGSGVDVGVGEGESVGVGVGSCAGNGDTPTTEPTSVE